MMPWACGYEWERQDTCSILMGNPERKRPLGRCRRRWEDNIKMGVQEIV
jgi:hypothetical protein